MASGLFLLPQHEEIEQHDANHRCDGQHDLKHGLLRLVVEDGHAQPAADETTDQRYTVQNDLRHPPTAQLGLRLRLDHKIDLPWFGSGWKTI